MAERHADYQKGLHEDRKKDQNSKPIKLSVDSSNILESVRSELNKDYNKKSFEFNDKFIVKEYVRPPYEVDPMELEEFFDLFGVKGMATSRKGQHLFVMNSDGKMNIDLNAHRRDPSGELMLTIGKIVGKACKLHKNVGVVFSDTLCRYLMDRSIDENLLDD